MMGSLPSSSAVSPHRLHDSVMNNNPETSKVGDANLRQLSTNDIRETGIEHDDIWDIKRLMENSVCVEYHYVRDGVRWYFMQQQVIEERRKLQSHAQRLIQRLQHQGNVLLNLLHFKMRMNRHQRKEFSLYCFPNYALMFCFKARFPIPTQSMEKP